MFKPTAGVVNRLLNRSGHGGRITRATAARTIGSRSVSSLTTNINVNNINTLPLQFRSNILSATNNNAMIAPTNTNNANINHCRSMVTITQTKSSDPPSLFSSHVVDDISSSASASSSSAPTYVINEDSTLIVTQSCLDQVERLLKQRRAREDQPENVDDGYFLRVFVDAGGCSGFQYQFEVDDELDDDEDVVVVMAKLQDDSSDNDGTVMRPRVVVDETSQGFLEGSTIDYVIEMIKSAFVVSDNPQSESACGCGSSFAMKNFEKFGAND